MCGGGGVSLWILALVSAIQGHLWTKEERGVCVFVCVCVCMCACAYACVFQCLVDSACSSPMLKSVCQ